MVIQTTGAFLNIDLNVYSYHIARLHNYALEHCSKLVHFVIERLSLKHRISLLAESFNNMVTAQFRMLLIDRNMALSKNRLNWFVF